MFIFLRIFAMVIILFLIIDINFVFVFGGGKIKDSASYAIYLDILKVKRYGKPDFNIIPADYIKKNHFKEPSKIEDWYVFDGGEVVPLKNTGIYHDVILRSRIKYTGNPKDTISETGIKKFSGNPRGMYISSASIDIYKKSFRIYNPKNELDVSVDYAEIVAFLIFLHLEKFLKEEQNKEEEETQRIEDLKHKAKMDMKDRETKKTIDRLSLKLPKQNPIDLDDLDISQLPEEFKDNCIKYNDALKELDRYDELGKEIFKMADIKLDEPKVEKSEIQKSIERNWAPSSRKVSHTEITKTYCGGAIEQGFTYTYQAGDKVVIKEDVKYSAFSQPLIDSVKGRPFTIAYVNSEHIILKEIMLKVSIKDVRPYEGH